MNIVKFFLVALLIDQSSHVLAQSPGGENDKLSPHQEFYYSELIIQVKCGQKISLALDDSFSADESARENASLEMYRIAKIIGKICEGPGKREWFEQQKINRLWLGHRKNSKEVRIELVNRALYFYLFCGDMHPGNSELLEKALSQLIASEGSESKE